MENQEMTQTGDSQRPSTTEDEFTKSIEEYTAVVALVVWKFVFSVSMPEKFLL